MNLNYKKMWDELKQHFHANNSFGLSQAAIIKMEEIEQREKDAEKKRNEELAKMEDEFGLPEGHVPPC